jgi:beta-glucosidase-like glycosyl hydrolase
VSKKVITNIIREKLQFDGFLLSDAIDMKALSENIVKKHNNALNAGVDATCYFSGNIEELERICNEKRFMTEKSLNRFENIKKVIHNPCEKIDVEAQRSLYNHGLNKWFDEIYLYDATEVLHQM